MSFAGDSSSYKTEWLKVGNVSYMTFVGQDVVAFGRGCFIVLYNVTTKEEIIYEANSEAKGEGVQCLVGYQMAHMFAFAEMSPNPRIFLVKYPSKENVCILQDDNISQSYVAMSFGEMECLVCLTGIPTFEIIVWCWRTGEKLASQPTGIMQEAQQSLRCSVSMPVSVCLLAKFDRETVFQLWQINICSKLCVLTKTEFNNSGLEPGTFISAFCFAPDGLLMAADTAGNLYVVKDETQSYLKVLSWPYVQREGSSVYPTNTLWFRAGVLMSGPNGFIQFIKRVSNLDFQPGWCVTNEGPLLTMAVNRNRDTLVGWSHKGLSSIWNSGEIRVCGSTPDAACCLGPRGPLFSAGESLNRYCLRRPADTLCPDRNTDAYELLLARLPTDLIHPTPPCGAVSLSKTSSPGSLVNIRQVDQAAVLEELKHYGDTGRLMTFVHPADKYLATIGSLGMLKIWDKTSGIKVGVMGPSVGFALALDCNPCMPYLAIGRSNGILQIVAVDDVEPYQLTELILCSEEITGVAFNSAGTLIVAASFKIGRIFVTQGLVGTGQKINVLDHYLSNDTIVNMSVISPKPDVHKLVVMVNPEDPDSPFANQINVYSLPRLEVEHRIVLSTEYCEIVQGERSLLAVPYLSRQIHYLDTHLGAGVDDVKVIKSEPSGHQIRRYHISSFGNHVLTYGWDGLIFLRNIEDLTPICFFEAHHRFNKGVKHAIVDNQAKYVISLGKEGNIVCTNILVSCGHNKEKHKVDTSKEAYFSKKVIAKPSSTKTWLETQTQQKLNIETSAAAPEIKQILKDFKVVQQELVHLLDENYKAPPEEQLDVLEFDLDVETREELLEEAKVERENQQSLLEAECLDCDRLAEVIKKNTWDTMHVKSRCIKAMLKDFSVDNCGLPPNPPNLMEELVWESESRKLSMEMSIHDHFEPWFPISEIDKSAGDMRGSRALSVASKDESVEEETKYDPYLMFGSSSHQFVNISPLHCSQFEICTSFNNTTEVVLLQKICIDLREHFNKLFDDMFIQKEKEMALLADRNNRLRVILSELSVTCNAPMDVEAPVDATWSQEEKTERIVTIENCEVPVMPYISPSEQQLLDKKAAEEERIRKLLAADNFRELALIEMMDGVLEVRWEDELKKDVPKPKCMLEKDPEDYNETDLKAIKDYDEKCKVLASERERYRKMLEIEYKKLENTIQESLTKFDNSLFELLQTRLRVEAAMNHEQLKILRIHQINDDCIRREMQEREIVNKVLCTEKETDFAHKQVALMQEATNECRNNYENLVIKDKGMGKKFKQEFSNTNATPAVLDQLTKYYRRRPKLHPKATQFPTLLSELARCVAENDNSSFMPPEFHEFITALDALDLPSSAVTHFDDAVWATLVRVRRAKIESELKVRAYALELKEAEYTLNVVTRQMKAARDRATAQVAELKASREETIRLSRDLQVQLVMKQGSVEAPLTGHISDFEHVVLINPRIVEKINEHVRAAGAKKLDAMKQVTKYHRINKYKEWEYKRMRMECEDLQEKLNNIESIKVTLEMKQYLKDMKKPPKDSAEEDAAFLRQTEDNYKNAVKNITDEIKEVVAKTKNFKRLNVETDRNILDLKCDVSEQQFDRDLQLEEKVSEAARKRMAMIVKRSQLVARIQQVHNDNLVLKAELELLRLKTYPTLKYKAPI